MASKNGWPLVSIGTLGVEHAQPAEPVGEHQVARQRRAASRLDPRRVRARGRASSGLVCAPRKCRDAGRKEAERQRARSTHATVILALRARDCTRPALRLRHCARRTYSGTGSTLSPGSPALYIREHRRIHARSLVTLQDHRVRVGAGVGGTCCCPADRSRRHVVVHAGQPRRAAAARRPRRGSRRVRRHPVDRRRPPARRELDAHHALAARMAGPSAPGHVLPCARRDRTSGWARLSTRRPSA